ncbi:NACHT domain-containing protein [Streptomyces zaomyceticus]|uniref:NACHT domain-containing protein n=1 Tax=Streptomyces zaomyceticus TaxID=68286 RepID=UPI0035DA8A75
MDNSSSARRGSISGASVEAGTDYRRGVAAYAVACGLAGVSLPGVEIPPAQARVASVSLETDDCVDDIRIDFESGQRAFVQAKRSLDAGKPLKDSVAQWVQAARAGLDPNNDRLVIVSGTLTGPLRHLRTVLKREKTDHPGSRTKEESSILSVVEEFLTDLSVSERESVLRCAVIWELRVEHPDESDAQQGIQHMRHVVSGGHEAARKAWGDLTALAGRTASLRGGFNLAGWLDALRGEGNQVSSAGGTPANQIETRRMALDRYSTRLAREGTQIDLRSLGAELPDLPLAEADAGIMVGTDLDDARAEGELIWSFLRRGRVILTGLPGGGKSTALKHLAACMASDASLPLPVRVSLRDINTADPHLSFRSRLISVAVRDARPADQSILSDEINERLDCDGGIALLLDSLDETYDQRAKVVSDIANFVAEIPEGVCVLVATRDIAYGQAATLGWPSLRLLPPSSPESTVNAVLELAASHKALPASSRTNWVSVRKAWVISALEKDDLLRETPLIPVLLALLAARRSTDSLPKRRARILEEVVRDIVARREVRRSDGRTLGPLSGSALESVSMQAFACEASEILNRQGKASAGIVVDVIAADLCESWGLPPAQATHAAREALRLFDETGIFVMSGAEEVISPRIELLAEIGDAMHVSTRPGDIQGWVSTRIFRRQFEPLILACNLNPEITESASSALLAAPGDVELARALVQSVKEGAELNGSAIRDVCKCLIGHVAEGTREGWRSWEFLVSLPVPDELRASAVSAAELHGPEYGLVARVSLDLKSGRYNLDDPQPLRDALALKRLPRRPSVKQGGGTDLADLMVDRTLIETQRMAAEILLDNVPGSAPLLVAAAENTSVSFHEYLKRLLSDRGFDDEVQEIRDEFTRKRPKWKIPPWLSAYDDSVYKRFLRLVPGEGVSNLSVKQQVCLDELADFVETMGLNDDGANSLYRQSDDFLQHLIRETVQLYGFDRSVLSSQALVVLGRMERAESSSPYFALFENATSRSKPDWSCSVDPEATTRLMLRLFKLGLGQAQFAAITLWVAPVAEYAVRELRNLLPDLHSSPRHERIAAMTLAALTRGSEFDSWTSSENPVLRSVVAEMMEPTCSGALRNSFRELLRDPDGHVQEAAIRNVVRSNPSDLAAILDGIINRPAPGWMCLICRTVNSPPGRTACSNEKCSIVGANPAQVAAEFRQESDRLGAALHDGQ